MIKIGIGVLVWIESKHQLPELKRCLDSLTDFYPVIIVNGKWKDIIGDNPRSIPEAIELIDSYSNIILIDSPNQLEPVNRNKFIVQGMKMDCDMMFWIDSDEWIELPCGYDFFVKGMENVFKKQPDCLSFHLHFFDPRFGGESLQKRGIRYPAFMRHRDRHNQLWFLDKEVLGHYTAKPPRGLIVYQDKSFRTKEHELEMRRRNLANPKH